MSVKLHTCPKCGKSLANRHNLSRHKKTCRSAAAAAALQNVSVGSRVRDRSPILSRNLNISSFSDGAEKSDTLNNPKIQTLLDEIINDSSDTGKPLPTVLQPTITDSDVFQKGHGEESPLRTKGDIIGYSDAESEDSLDISDIKSKDDDMESAESETSIDISDIESKDDDMESEMGIEEFILPDTIEGIRARFNKLYVEFIRQKNHEHRHELVLLLDEMLRQDAITPTKYVQLNTSLTEAADLKTDKREKEEEEEEKHDGDEEQNVMKSAFDYIIQHDKEELLELMEELKAEIGEEYIDEVHKIEELIGLFLEEEFLDGEPTRPRIDELLKRLETSDIPKSQRHRIKMLLDDIVENRYRVQQIIQRLMEAENKDELSTILRMLVREELLSDEQFEQLVELEDPDLEKIKEVITDTKIGQGLNFLPRTISNLRHTLHSLLTELKENGTELIKSKVASILEELSRRKAIRLGEYANLKELIETSLEL